MTSDELRTFLVQYGDALIAVDLTTIVASYALPVLVLSDAGSIPVGSAADIETAARAAAERYRAAGIISARPIVRAFDPISTELTSADIDWEYRSAGMKTVFREAYRYILRTPTGKPPRIQVVIAQPLM